jgi:hypothetical protein
LLPILLSLFVLVPAAHAEPIQWSYESQVTVSGPAPSDEYKGVTSYGGLAFSNLSGTGVGSQSVNAFGVTAYLLRQRYSQDSDHFAVNLRITDSASGQSGVFTFHGYLQGYTGFYSQLGGSWENHTAVSGTYLDPTPPALRLGGNLYKVNISPFGVYYDRYHEFYYPNNPGDHASSSDTSSGSLNDTSAVSVQVTSTAPEPSTLALAASGITVLGCRLWRRRRRGPP